MKPTVSTCAAVTAVVFFAISEATSLQAQAVRYGAVPNASKVRMEGTSTVHDWAVETTLVGGFMELPADFPLDPSKPLPATLSAQPKVQVNIPVSSLHNDKQSPAMDERMNKELKSSQYRQIQYRLTEIKPGKAEAGKLTFDAKGELTVAGATNVISMPVTFEKQPGNKLKVAGAVSLKMSDYQIAPPTFSIIGLPLMKTGDELKLTFEWVTVEKPATE